LDTSALAIDTNYAVADDAPSVRALYRTSAPSGWAMGTMKAMPTVPLLGGFLAGRSSWSPPFGDPFREAMRDCGDAVQLDLGCVLGAGTFELPHEKTVDDVVMKGGAGLRSSRSC
jgi:hypothetical protein